MICLFFKELLDAGEEKWGTDEEVFNRIFSINDFYTLNRVWTEYVKVRHGPQTNKQSRYKCFKKVN